VIVCTDWSFSLSLLELQNGYGTLHGGAVGSLVEVLTTACARTVVAEDKELFLGEISISYLSGTPINVSSCFQR
jgi:acyl-coenzyme A thioesterase 13